MTGSRGAVAGWRLAARLTAGDDRAGVSLRILAARFPRFAFGTRRMRDGVSFEAVRQDRDEPGVYAVITDDLGEMRRVLLEDIEDFPPGSETQPGGDQAGGPDG